MSYVKRIQRMRARRRAEAPAPELSHEQLTAKAISLGYPGFCGGWNTETLKRKIKERENGKA